MPRTSKRLRIGGATDGVRSTCTLHSSSSKKASRGDAEAAAERLGVLKAIAFLSVTDEALALAETIVRQGLVPETVAEDAAHIAIATVNAADYLLTWNLKHIANAAVRNRAEALCRAEGYEPATICTSEEFMEEL